jgi:hypothetical protein
VDRLDVVLALRLRSDLQELVLPLRSIHHQVLLLALLGWQRVAPVQRQESEFRYLHQLAPHRQVRQLFSLALSLPAQVP